MIKARVFIDKFWKFIFANQVVVSKLLNAEKTQYEFKIRDPPKYKDTKGTKGTHHTEMQG